MNKNNNTSTDKAYEIERLIDILEIPEDRIDVFLSELKEWYKLARNMNNLVNTVAEAVGEETNANRIKMRWIDDGKKNKKIVITGVEHEPRES